ncbi:MAG: hypothetical protein KOO63_13295 [Bacteroidales bacterium]|nr:hypothetical protein [Candidatus Latescibacterota bacterium]
MLSQLDGRKKINLIALLVGAGILLVVGWKMFWFLTDDAYISFRYVSNSILGHGYVWNAAPFRPVEGYTNFLWIILLDVVWRIFKVSPPESANFISLVFSFLTFMVVSAGILQLRWSRKLHPHRIVILGLVLLGLVVNRTVLTWSSSGLETAMFNFFLILWIYICVFVPITSRWWVVSLTSLAVCIYLTRPDGILFLASTLLLLGWTFIRNRDIFRMRHLAGASPLLLVLSHIVWRRATYGEWLPNTYYAKFTGSWPESGARHLLSFILEYSLWVWIGLALYVLIKRLVKPSPRETVERASRRTAVFVVTVTLLAHLLYYTIMIGGDHFEYRIFSHLIFLVFLSFVWFLNNGRIKPTASIIMLIVFITLSLPVPWTHWAHTHDLNTREETHKLRYPVAPHWPGPVRWYANLFDEQQSWLIDHYVCVRHQEHKVNCEYLISLFPSRASGLKLHTGDYPVLAFPAIGVASWVLPQVNIIDLHGLNDYVIARNPPEDTGMRMMAHDRSAPEGYVQCFMPNVQLRGKKDLVIHERRQPLTAADIIECETRWAETVRTR